MGIDGFSGTVPMSTDSEEDAGLEYITFLEYSLNS